MYRLLGIATAGFMSTLGIYPLNIHETKESFARAGIKEMDLSKAPELAANLQKSATVMLEVLWSDLHDDSVMFETMDFTTVPSRDASGSAGQRWPKPMCR